MRRAACPAHILRIKVLGSIRATTYLRLTDKNRPHSPILTGRVYQTEGRFDVATLRLDLTGGVTAPIDVSHSFISTLALLLILFGSIWASAQQPNDTHEEEALRPSDWRGTLKWLPSAHSARA